MIQFKMTLFCVFKFLKIYQAILSDVFLTIGRSGSDSEAKQQLPRIAIKSDHIRFIYNFNLNYNYNYNYKYNYNSQQIITN